jgi:ribosomal protein S18 acetylase RimI-like enzyme
MIALDWRTVSAAHLAPHFDAERRRWLADLRWDYSSTLADIEAARVSCDLPGFVAREGGEIIGWSYHLLHRGSLQIGGMVATSPAVTALLLDATLKSAEGRAATSRMVFGYFDAPGLESQLSAAGFASEAYRYLQLDLHSFGGLAVPDAFDPYDFTRTGEIAQLLQTAYGHGPSLRPFARGGSADEWREYVTQLTLTDACGTFDPGLSLMATDRDGVITGAALVSRISTDTLHLGQIVIRPDAQRAGRAMGMLTDVCAGAKKNWRHLSLLVAASNEKAQRLYAGFGFRETARFLSASTPALSLIAAARPRAVSTNRQ